MGFLGWLRTHTFTWRDFFTALAQAFLAGVVVIAMLLMVSTIYRIYYNTPPIHVERIDPVDLGTLCPGDSYPVSNRITIQRPLVVLLYVSTLDSSGTHNVEGTQTTYGGRPNPRAVTFDQHLPWEVPDLPPGKYVRVLALRGTNGAEDPIFVESSYTIGANCT